MWSVSAGPGGGRSEAPPGGGGPGCSGQFRPWAVLALGIPLGRAVPGHPLNTPAVGEEGTVRLAGQLRGLCQGQTPGQGPHVSPSPSGSEMIETQEDIYVGSIETDRGVREQVRFYDTRGLRDGLELPKHCFSCTDGYVLVYSTDSKESFKRVELLKKEIDKSKDKKEVSSPGEGAAEWDLLPWGRFSPFFSPACHKMLMGP